MAYEHLIKNDPIPKTLKYNGIEETVYFRRLTAGENMALKRGRKAGMRDGQTNIEMDMAEIDASNHLMLFYANCDENGKQVFKTQQEVGKLPNDLVHALLTLCSEALKDPDEGN